MKPLKKREEEDIDVPMAPMIDVVFQLLIFFMVASTFHKLETEQGVKLPVADRSKTKMESYAELVVNVFDDGTIRINQQEFDIDRLQQTLSESMQKSARIKIFIRGDRKVEHGRILSVMAVCRNLGIEDVAIAAYQVSPEGH